MRQRARQLWHEHEFDKFWPADHQEYAFADLFPRLFHTYRADRASIEVWFYDEDIRAAHDEVSLLIKDDHHARLLQAAWKFDSWICLHDLALALCVACKLALQFKGAIPQARVRTMLQKLGIKVPKGGLVSLFMNTFLEIGLLRCIDPTTHFQKSRVYEIIGRAASLPFVVRVNTARERQRAFLAAHGSYDSVGQKASANQGRTPSTVYGGNHDLDQFSSATNGGQGGSVEHRSWDDSSGLSTNAPTEWDEYIPAGTVWFGTLDEWDLQGATEGDTETDCWHESDCCEDQDHNVSGNTELQRRLAYDQTQRDGKSLSASCRNP